jgi:tryptophan synthase alpha chain
MVDRTSTASRPDFFAAAPEGEPGLAVFLNAGDPPLDVLPDVVAMLDESRVDCLELAVPFPGSVTDGPVVRRSADRALAGGVGLADVLACLTGLARPRHLRIVLLADWGHTVRPLGIDEFLWCLLESGVDGLLVHGLPAILRAGYYNAARQLRVPVVTTCYPGSGQDVRAESARNATAYLYLVAHYGRSGTAPPEGFRRLRPVISELRASTAAPIAVGFGVRGRAEIEALREAGADAAVIGSAAVARVEQAIAERRDVVAELARLMADLQPSKGVIERC